MECEEPWLLCQNGRKTYLLAQNDRAYYRIEVNDALSYETEQWLMIRGISEELLSELLLEFEVFPKTQIRGVGIGGCGAGDSIYLYLKTDKRVRHILSDDYPKEQVDVFFSGIPRFTPPQAKNSKSGRDWRRENRDPELFDKMKYVVPVLSLTSVVFNVGYLYYENWMWYLGCLLCIAIPVLLDIVFPAYFTLLLPGKEEKTDAWELVWPMFIHMLTLLIFPGKNWLNESLFLVVWIIVGGAAVLVLGLFAEEFKRKRSNLLIVFLAAGVMGSIAVGHVNEVFDFSEPETYILNVQDMHHSSGRNDIYECTVTLPDGRKTDLEVSRSFYNALELGDKILVEHSVGAFGIEYANAYPLE